MLIAGGVAVAAGLAVYGGYRLHKSGTLDGFIKSGKEVTTDLATKASKTPSNLLTKEKIDKMYRQANGDFKVKDSHGLLDRDKNVNVKSLTNNLVSKKDEPKPLSDFLFERALRVDADGKSSYIDLPVDREGYADSFARQMSKMTGSEKDYDYYYKYIMNKIS